MRLNLTTDIGILSISATGMTFRKKSDYTWYIHFYLEEMSLPHCLLLQLTSRLAPSIQKRLDAHCSLSLLATSNRQIFRHLHIFSTLDKEEEMRLNLTTDIGISSISATGMSCKQKHLAAASVAHFSKF